MIIAAIGTEGSLKHPFCDVVEKEYDMFATEPDIEGIASKLGIVNLRNTPPELAYKFFDEVVQEQNKQMAGKTNVIVRYPAPELLAYYLYFCAPGIPEETTRNVIRNLYDLSKAYRHTFLITLDRDTYQASTTPFSGNIMTEYSYEYMMRGVLDRYGVFHHAYHDKQIEGILAEAYSVMAEG